MKTIKRVLIMGAGLFVSLNLLQAQTAVVSGFTGEAIPIQAIGEVSAQPDSVVQVAAESQGLEQVAPQDLPVVGGTFYWVLPEGGIVPTPFPQDVNNPIYEIAPGIYLEDTTGGQIALPPRRLRSQSANINMASAVSAEVDAVVNVINQVQDSEFTSELMASFGLEEESDSPSGFSPMFALADTNALWLEITNVANGYSYLNLHNATNQVYAIWSATNVATPFASWQVETELWPTTNQTSVLPFTLQNFYQQTLFYRAEDWTGVDSDGDGVPDWWDWKYFGTINIVSTNLDFSGNGYTFTQDYSNNIPPKVFSFNGIILTNDYVSSGSVAAQLDVAGYPYYITTLVDDTNFDGAVWNTYASTNITLNLGLAEGWHEVWIGLRGHADDASVAAWQWRRIKVDYTPPALILTSPTNGTVDTPMIQLMGYSLENLSSISYDITNAAGLLTNQQISVTDRHYDSVAWEFTTNSFQGYDIFLTNGVNTITIHATDLTGNVTTTNLNFTLDYSTKTNPPMVQLTWPTNGTLIIGNNFNLDGQLADPTATVRVSITDTNGNTNTVAGLVGRSGKFWVQNIPLSAGTNALTLTVVDVVGNITVTNINLVQSPLVLTLDPVADSQQLWQPTINLTGTISDATYAVWVNGVKGTNNGNGTWAAQNVPVDSGGTASFTVTGYSSDETQPDGSHGN